MKVNTEERVEKAVSLFNEGYNCSQAVASAFADIYGIDEKLMLKLATGFGGGIGRTRETCGAVCGMVMLASLEKGYGESPNNKAKAECYATVQKLINEFRATHGTTICAELLGVSRNAQHSVTPEARTAEYYKKRPCPQMVASAARIYANFLNSNE